VLKLFQASYKQQRDRGLKVAQDALEEKPMDSGEYRPPSSVKQVWHTVTYS